MKKNKKKHTQEQQQEQQQQQEQTLRTTDKKYKKHRQPAKTASHQSRSRSTRGGIRQNRRSGRRRCCMASAGHGISAGRSATSRVVATLMRRTSLSIVEALADVDVIEKLLLCVVVYLLVI